MSRLRQCMGWGLAIGLAVSLPAGAAGADPPLEIPEVVVEGSDPAETGVPPVMSSEPHVDTEFSPPPLGPSASERELGQLTFRTEPQLFGQDPLSWRDGSTSLKGGFGGLSFFQVMAKDTRRLGNLHSIWQGDWTAGTGLAIPWQRQILNGGIGWSQDGWRFSLGADGQRMARQNSDATSQLWGNGRLAVVQPLTDGTIAYRLGWESGQLAAAGSDVHAHGGDLAARWEPHWGSHRPYLDVGGGYHWAQATSWPVAAVDAGDRFALGPSDWDVGARYQLVGGDHSVAPRVRINWRGWPETLVGFSLDGGQREPYAGALWRQRPYARIGDGLRSEHVYGVARLHLERRLTRGLYLGLGAEAGGLDRRLYWAQAGEGPYWSLRNADGPMALGGCDVAVRYELGAVTPFVTYRFQQAWAPDPKLPSDGSHDLRAGLRLGVGRLRAEAATHLLGWALSPVASGRDGGVLPNMLMLDCALAYAITDNVQLHVTVGDWVLRSNDVLPGYWEPAFTALAGIGAHF